MLAVTANRLGTIQRASRALLIFFIFMSVISLLGTLSGLTHPFPPGSRTVAGIVFEGAAISGKIQSLWFAQTAAGAALNLIILYQLVRLMMLYSKGQLFTAQNVARVRQIGLTFMCAPAVWLVVLIAAWPEIAAAQDQWTSVMPSFPGGALMSSGIFLFATRLLDEARQLRDEQDLVV